LRPGTDRQIPLELSSLGGRALIIGHVSKAHTNVSLVASHIKQVIGLSLGILEKPPHGKPMTDGPNRR
jgi:hypothetical protein